MGLNVKKQLAHAERLLKQGKVPDALLELERLADSAPNDVLTLNRIGDLLAKQGRRDEAIRFYGKIADQFAQSGFLPKAVAIHKKILRLNTDHIASLVELGSLYFEQKLPGEARTYLLRAADQYLQARNFSKAREVYEKLVEAEPEDPRHRARLAEARAAEGETARAGEDLLELAETLFVSGQPVDAEKAYRRAGELLPNRDEPLIGLVRSLGEQGRNDEALTLLDQAERDNRNTSVLLGERILRFEQVGRGRDAAELLKLPSATEIDDPVFIQIFRFNCERGESSAVWERYDPLLARLRDSGQGQRLIDLLVAVADIESDGHVPALQRLLDAYRAGADEDRTRQTLEQLVLACRAHSRGDDAERYLATLGELAPDSPLLENDSVATESPSAPRTPVVEPSATDLPASPPPPPRQPVVDADGDPPIEAEAPAVPLNRGDEDYVSGRMTQAEILEKYGLHEQALEQLHEVTTKFPGHVPAQEKRVELHRERGRSEELLSALVALALARRAAGDADGAQTACAEAAQHGTFDAPTATMLAQLGLIDGGAPIESAAELELEPLTEAVTVSAPEPVVEPVQPEPAPLATVQPAAADGAVFIDFDAMDDDEAEDLPQALPVEEPVPVVEQPLAVEASSPAVEHQAGAGDVVAEIGRLLDQGETTEAERRLEALETLGWGGEQIAPLRERIETVKRDAEPDVLKIESEAMDIPLDVAGDDDLSAITAALESELFADESEPVAAEPESEQSLEDVFAAFKEQVEREVDSDDYRTHYDLGIAYKEMGLIDEAVAEFEQSVKSTELDRESFSMLALCYRERDDLEAAAKCYRLAIGRSEGETVNHLRYELAELLETAGDRDGALDELRHLFGADPSFRDVRERIVELESCAS